MAVPDVRAGNPQICGISTIVSPIGREMCELFRNCRVKNPGLPELWAGASQLPMPLFSAETDVRRPLHRSLPSPQEARARMR